MDKTTSNGIRHLQSLLGADRYNRKSDSATVESSFQPHAPTPSVHYTPEWLAENDIALEEVGPRAPYKSYGTKRNGDAFGHEDFTDTVLHNATAGGPPEAPSIPGVRRPERPLVIPPPRPASAPESGTLPGEEQVTTRDVLRQLSPAEQAALQRKYDAGGHKDIMSYDDWLSENFGDMPPQERAAQMRSSATATPRMNIGVDPLLEAGENSELAQSRQRAGKPLPEGREPKQYEAWQAREMSRNVHSPEVPMTRFGGTFTLNADGSRSSRAPSPDAMAQADAIAADQGQYSPSHIIAMAQAFGIDAHQYGDDIDLLRGDVLREEKRHDERAKGYDVVDNGMGGFRYAPNQRMKDYTAGRDRLRIATNIGNRYSGMMTPEQEMLLETAVNSPDGFNEMVRLGQTLNRIRLANSNEDVRNRARNYNMTRDMASPNYAPGMAARSLQQAATSGDPLQMAAVYDIFGRPDAASQSRQLSGVQTRSAAELAAATANAGGGAAAVPEDKTLAAQQDEQLQSIYAIENPKDREEALTAYLEKVHPAWTAEQRAAQSQEMLAAHLARTQGTNDPYVKNHLAVLRKDKTRFKLFARQHLGLSEEDAERLYNSAGTPSMSAEQMGEAAVNAVGGAGTAVGNFVGGVGRGVGRGLGLVK